jgi:hypothetical protein
LLHINRAPPLNTGFDSASISVSSKGKAHCRCREGIVESHSRGVSNVSNDMENEGGEGSGTIFALDNLNISHSSPPTAEPPKISARCFLPQENEESHREADGYTPNKTCVPVHDTNVEENIRSLQRSCSSPHRFRVVRRSQIGNPPLDNELNYCVRPETQRSRSAYRRVERSRSWKSEQSQMGSTHIKCEAVHHTKDASFGWGSGTSVSDSSTNLDKVHEGNRQTPIGTQHSKGSSVSPQQKRCAARDDTKISSPQGHSDDEIIRRSPCILPRGTDGATLGKSVIVGSLNVEPSEMAILFSLPSHVKITETLSPLGLGLGQSWKGIGTEPLQNPLWTYNLTSGNHSPQENYHSVVSSQILSSSDQVSSAYSVDGVRVKPQSVRSNRVLASLTSNIIDTYMIESWDVENIFKPIAGIIRRHDCFLDLFLSKTPVHKIMRRSKMSMENVNIIIESQTIEDVNIADVIALIKVFQVPKKGRDRSPDL